MLYDPSKRPTAAQALQYPFFMKGIQVPAGMPPAGVGAPMEGDESYGAPSDGMDSGDAAAGPYGASAASVEPAKAPGYSFAAGYGGGSAPSPAPASYAPPAYGAAIAGSAVGRVGSGEADDSGSKYSKMARYAPGKPVGSYGGGAPSGYGAAPSYAPAPAAAPVGAYGIPAYGSFSTGAPVSKVGSSDSGARRSGGAAPGGARSTFMAAGMANLGGSGPSVPAAAAPSAAPVGYGRHKY